MRRSNRCWCSRAPSTAPIASRASSRPPASATATLHSNRTQGQRLPALKRFKSGDVRVLIATDIAARGIDVDGISHVINFDFPPQPEDYVHRIGRTGRAQAIGDAISFVTHEDADSLRRLERFLGRGITRKKLEGYVRLAGAARTPPPAPADKAPEHDASCAQQRRPKGAVETEGPALGIVRSEAVRPASRPAARPPRPHLKHCRATTVIHCHDRPEALVVRPRTGEHVASCVRLSSSFPSSACRSRQACGGASSAAARNPAAAAAARSKSSACSVEPLARSITVTGTLAAEEQVTLSFKVTGRVEDLRVDLGSRVRKGDVIARLTSTDFELRLRQADAALAAGARAAGTRSRAARPTRSMPIRPRWSARRAPR